MGEWRAHELRQGPGDLTSLVEGITRPPQGQSKARGSRKIHDGTAMLVDWIVRTFSCVSNFPVFARSVGRASNTR